jgi:hypothetical protein
MNITSRLFEAFLKCPSKCFLRSRGETATENGCANSIQAENETYRRVSTDQVTAGTLQDEHATGAICAHDRESAKWKWALGPSTIVTVTKAKKVTISGLTLAGIYQFQIRALGVLGYTDFMDTKTFERDSAKPQTNGGNPGNGVAAIWVLGN